MKGGEMTSGIEAEVMTECYSFICTASTPIQYGKLKAKVEGRSG